jgi:CubicO group peptidase (beta-lactamase class C family)
MVVRTTDGFRALRRLAKRWAVLVSLASVAGAAQGGHVLRAQAVDVFADIDRAFDEYRLDAHVPGLVYGVVMDGRLVHVKGLGIQDLESQRPVTAETLFRIARVGASGVGG